MAKKSRSQRVFPGLLPQSASQAGKGLRLGRLAGRSPPRAASRAEAGETQPQQCSRARLGDDGEISPGLEDSASLPEPHVLAQEEIAEDLRASLEEVESILAGL